MSHSKPPRPSRRDLFGVTAGVAASSLLPATAWARRSQGQVRPVLVGSANALAGMQKSWEAMLAGASAMDTVIETVKVVEADPNDRSVGLGGLPNEVGAVALDAACMDASTHNSGAVAAIENILHPSEVARLVMERTDHCLIVGRGAYEFARMHGHPHAELLTEETRKIWLRWKETMSDADDRFPPPPADKEDRRGGALEVGDDGVRLAEDDPSTPPNVVRHGTVHCSGVGLDGHLACTTTTSGLAWKIPGRVGDSPIIGAGLYCDAEAGSAGSTGRGEAAILANGSFAIVEQMRAGATPLDAGLEVLRRISRQVKRQARWQPGLMGADGRPSFNINFYVLHPDGRWAGVRLKGGGKFAVADPAGGPRHEEVVPLFE